MTREEICNILDWFYAHADHSSDGLLARIEKAINIAVAAEREACAKVCEERADNAWSIGEAKFAGSIAAAIRARSNEGGR